MLEGPARMEGSVDGWAEFKKMFVANFSSTYRRPNRPETLRVCTQGADEMDRKYLTRWSIVRNICEGVEENRAIGWFTEGCKNGSMLWQKFRRNPPSSLAEAFEIATAYAQADPTQPRSSARPMHHAGCDAGEGSRQHDRSE